MKLFAAGSFVINEEKAEFDQLLKILNSTTP